MSTHNVKIVDELASIIQLIADAWPNNRENAAIAGARFENITDDIEEHCTEAEQLAQLIWHGIKYLYEKDEFYIAVKSNTMQAVNIIRETLHSDEYREEEYFTKAFNELKDALCGGKESADSVITEEELKRLMTYKSKKKLTQKDIIEFLGEITALLSTVKINDRDNVAKAGGKFEDIFDFITKNSSQITKLAKLTWDGLRHLYSEDENFSDVKIYTSNAIQMFKKYIQTEGDIQVEEFEKTYENLENALLIAENKNNQNDQKNSSIEELGKGLLLENTTLDDAAAYIMMLDEKSVTNNQIEQLAGFVINSINNESDGVKNLLKEAYSLISDVYYDRKKEDGWLSLVSIKIEAATVHKGNEEWKHNEVNSSSVTSRNAVPVNGNSQDEKNQHHSNNAREPFYVPVDIDVSLVSEFITECRELIEAAEVALLELENLPNDEELVNTVFRAYHTIKGTSAFMGLEPITEFTHFVETVLSNVRDGDLPFDRACADINFESIDIIKQMLNSVEQLGVGDFFPLPSTYQSMLGVLIDVSENNISPEDALSNRTVNKSSTSSKINIEKSTSSGEELKVDTPSKDSIQEVSKFDKKNDIDFAMDANIQAPKSESESSVRVNVSRLDRLIDMVGELVIAHSVVAQDHNIPNDSELQKKVNHATKIIRELQDSSLTLRMVPLKATFHKMNRLVRDLSKKAGKPVKFLTIGEETEIDRNMVDIINEPLIHMLRNSLDHGIETPEEREKTSKNNIANISLKAFQEGGKVVIQITDDGRGINKEVIHRKAVEKGLVDPDKKMTDSEIYGLIFLPGFSSAEKVTDLSGRGVGMDVVRRSIDQLQGKVEVTSALGVGTTITIELPFTLAITDGMLIRVGDQRFIVPTINIDMTFRADSNDLFTILGESEQVSFRGKPAPVIRLHRLFEIDGAEENILEGTMLIIKNNNDRYALLVDEVIGQQQLVGKSINMITTTKHISGGAILGDGRVGLILDTAYLNV